ncbi:hypothetical protein TCAL_16999 [Tigriopus californicus]|uniref:Uncharacterized protein n=1 Tax=Tigriopus californicus TaxID=6832 RepID=A0A553PGM2_TIGCA|nr:hypothetical protein TCAL_16999 [Tigriopus californicus]
MNGDPDLGSMDFGIDINEMVAQRLATQTKKTVHLKELLRDTKFTKEEIKNMYRGFKQIHVFDRTIATRQFVPR